MKTEPIRFAFKCIFVATSFILFAVCFAPIGVSAAENGPAQLVKQYCEFDFMGSRLTSDGFTKLKDMIEWETEPGWDSMIVIRGFKIGSPKKRKGEIIIPVSYDVLGVLDGWKWTGVRDMDRSVVKQESQKVFCLAQRKDKWKIAEPMFPPHVGLSYALKQCREAWPHYEGGRNDDGQMEALRQTLIILEKLGKAN